jgi:hypothetical protein
MKIFDILNSTKSENKPDNILWDDSNIKNKYFDDYITLKSNELDETATTCSPRYRNDNELKTESVHEELNNIESKTEEGYILENKDNQKESDNESNISTSENTLYVISINNIPHFYHENYETAKEYLYKLGLDCLKQKVSDFTINEHYLQRITEHHIEIKSNRIFFNDILFTLNLEIVTKIE